MRITEDIPEIVSKEKKYKNKEKSIIQKPLFSVIIATYNRAGLIERALKSLLLQDEKDWEGIIVDDESTDNTYSVIYHYLKKDNRIKYFKKPHSGEALTKNYGIKVATGKYITFLDSDDEYRHDHLSSRKIYLSENPGIRFLYGGVKILGNQYVPDKNNPSEAIHLKDCIIGGTFVIERGILNSLGGFKSIILGPDSDLFRRAVNSKIPISKLDLPSYIYHHENPDSITNLLYKSLK